MKLLQVQVHLNVCGDPELTFKYASVHYFIVLLERPFTNNLSSPGPNPLALSPFLGLIYLQPLRGGGLSLCPSLKLGMGPAVNTALFVLQQSLLYKQMWWEGTGSQIPGRGGRSPFWRRLPAAARRPRNRTHSVFRLWNLQFFQTGAVPLSLSSTLHPQPLFLGRLSPCDVYSALFARANISKRVYAK